MPTIIAAGRTALEGLTSLSHSDWISAVCVATGNSSESVRGTLIKGGNPIFREGWQYENSRVFRGEGGSIVVDYTSEGKAENWKIVRSFLPPTIDTLVTLGGRHGTDILEFMPNKAISYDIAKFVTEKLKHKMPWVETVHGDIFDHSTPATVLNLDLIGYMCGKNFAAFQRAASVGHQYIVITIQGQKEGFRNSGAWVSQAYKKYRCYKDKNLRALKDAMAGYQLLKGHFYRRAPEGHVRTMRTTVWEVA